MPLPKGADFVKVDVMATYKDGSRTEANALANDWPYALEVYQLLGATALDAKKDLAILRREGSLLGVWVAAENRYRYPRFQFFELGLKKQMKDLMSTLPADNGSGWGYVQWFYTPHARLDKKTPADVFKNDPDTVVAAARIQFSEGPDAGW